MVRSRISPRSVRHRPAGKVERRAADGVGDLIERQSVPPQIVLRYLDGDLVGWRAHEVDVRDLGNRGEIVANPLGDLLQSERVDVAGDRDVDDLLPDGQLANDRFLRL